MSRPHWEWIMQHNTALYSSFLYLEIYCIIQAKFVSMVVDGKALVVRLAECLAPIKKYGNSNLGIIQLSSSFHPLINWCQVIL